MPDYSKIAKLLNKTEKDAERITETLLSDSYNMFKFDVYTEYFNVFKDDDNFIEFLVSFIGSKRIMELVNNYDNEEFARKFIDFAKKKNKLDSKYFVKNKTGSLLKYMKSVELKLIIGNSKRIESKINNILEKPKDINSVDIEIVIEPEPLIEKKITKAKKIKKPKDLKNISFKDMTEQNKYDYLFLEDFNSTLFRKCVGGNFKDVKLKNISLSEFIRLDRLNLSMSDLKGLIDYIYDKNSIIFWDIIKSIVISSTKYSRIDTIFNYINIHKRITDSVRKDIIELITLKEWEEDEIPSLKELLSSFYK